MGGEGDAPVLELMYARGDAHAGLSRLGSSYDDGCVGGDSPIKLPRFPGDPEKGARIQSELWAVLAEIEGVENASRDGDVAVTVGFPCFGGGTAVGLTSGDCAYGEDASDDESLKGEPFL